MANNNLEVTQKVARLMLARFRNVNPFIMTAFRGYEEEYKDGYAYGDTLRIRRQNQFLVTDSRIATNQAVNQTTELLTINHQFNSLISFTTKQLSLFLDKDKEFYRQQFLYPIIDAISKTSEVSVAQEALTNVYYTVGDPAAPLNSYAAIDAIRVKMVEQAMPTTEGIYCAMTPRSAGALRSAVNNNFNPTLNTDVTFYARLGNLAGIDLFESNSIQLHTAGSGAGTPVTSALVTSGNTIAMSGFTGSAAGVLKKGDILTFTNPSGPACNSVNPTDRSDTGQLMQFVVTSADPINASGGGTVTITVNPTIISDPSSASRNVTTPILSGATVNILGRGLTYRMNMAYVSRGLSMVTPPMAIPPGAPSAYLARDANANLALRVIECAYDSINDLSPLRLDLLMGSLWHGQYAVRVVSSV